MLVLSGKMTERVVGRNTKRRSVANCACGSVLKRLYTGVKQVYTRVIRTHRLWKNPIIPLQLLSRSYIYGHPRGITMGISRMNTCAKFSGPGCRHHFFFGLKKDVSFDIPLTSTLLILSFFTAGFSIFSSHSRA